MVVVVVVNGYEKSSVEFSHVDGVLPNLRFGAEQSWVMAIDVVKTKLEGFLIDEYLLVNAWISVDHVSVMESQHA